MNVKDLTAEQRAELKAQLEAEERAEKQKRQDDIDAYKQSVDDFVRGTFERMKRVRCHRRCGGLRRCRRHRPGLPRGGGYRSGREPGPRCAGVRL